MKPWERIILGTAAALAGLVALAIAFAPLIITVTVVCLIVRWFFF